MRLVRRRAGSGAYLQAEEPVPVKMGVPVKMVAQPKAEVPRRAGLGAYSRAEAPAAQERRGVPPVALHLRVAALAAVRMGEKPMVRPWPYRMPCVSLKTSGMLLPLLSVAPIPCLACATPPRTAARPWRVCSTLIARAALSTIRGYPAQAGRHGLTGWRMSTDELVLLPEDLCRLVQAETARAAVVTGGNGADRYLEVFRAILGPEAVRAQIAGPSALAVGRLALARLARGEHDDLETSVPRYGRPPDITKTRSAA